MFKFSRKTQNNNVIYLIDECSNKKKLKKIDGCSIKFHGNNNQVVINLVNNMCPFKMCHFKIMISDPQTQVNNFNVDIQGNSSIVTIGKKFGCQGCSIIVNDDRNEVIIGENCMFSWNVQIISSDGHSIYDTDTKKILNLSNSISIGNHCWVGSDVKILKNVHLADNTIVGANSLVTRSCNMSNVILAGNPAQVVKQNVSWNGLPPSKFNNNMP